MIDLPKIPSFTNFDKFSDNDVRVSIQSIDDAIATIDEIPESQWDEETTETREGITLVYTVREFRQALLFWREAVKTIENKSRIFSETSLHKTIKESEKVRLLQILDMIMGFPSRKILSENITGGGKV